MRFYIVLVKWNVQFTWCNLVFLLGVFSLTIKLWIRTEWDKHNNIGIHYHKLVLCETILRIFYRYRYVWFIWCMWSFLTFLFLLLLLQTRNESTSSDLTSQMSEETKAVTERKARIVTFSMPDSSTPSFLHHSLKLNCPKQERGSGPNQAQEKVNQEKSLFLSCCKRWWVLHFIIGPYYLFSLILFSMPVELVNHVNHSGSFKGGV